MSPPSTQYVYIPNLVGRQMLRIPLDAIQAEAHMSITPTPAQPPHSSNHPSPSRTSSRSSSVSSIETVE
ncbi:hypothetical protein BDU57DRAFT_443076 [Ampelomyces quisqualis]|uniref:Uncharacterized protein n=1 Tax=Ampelomyces quisqualis TaxID=50730 RepID=A0A6A5QXW1_AMPQU|nr:hypothetical protein BDU57DRAFT_443076 [Ampelomyces quisqualis]